MTGKNIVLTVNNTYSTSVSVTHVKWQYFCFVFTCLKQGLQYGIVFSCA